MSDALGETIDDPDRPVPPPDPVLARGIRLGRYVALERLGSGGMGVVYACYDPELDRKVAVKLLHPSSTSSEGASEGRVRLVREARALAKLSHPNVVAVHDVGTWSERVYVAMEFIDGMTLKAWLAARPRSWRDVVDAYRQAARGLAAAHEAGLVHRDFKPDNAMITEASAGIGRVRVMDFGLARPLVRAALRERSELDDAPVELTRVGAVMGTPAYMAPEQHNGLAADARTDQFSWGVALFEALYGRRPFAGETAAEIAVAVTTGRMVAPPRDTGVPAHVHRVVLRALALDPTQRFATMDAAIEALDRDPGRTRARRLAIAAVVLGAAGVVLVRQLVTSSRERACAEEGDAIAEVWGESSRAATERALLDSGVASAAQTWTKLQPWLDDYAAKWADARTQSCRAAEIEHTASPDQLALGRECLDERREALAKLVAALSRAPDANVMNRAVTAASRLPQLQPCRDPLWISQHAFVPRAPDLREAVLAARTKLVESRAEGNAGRYKDALVLAREGLELAQSAGWENAIAEATFEVARQIRNAGEGTGESELVLAYEIATRIGDDERAADIAAALVHITGAVAGRVEVGLTWGTVAEALVERIGQRDGLRGAALSNNLGIVERVAGNYERAAEHHERALAIREAMLGVEHPDVASSLQNLGNVWFSAGRLELALPPLQRAVELAERTLGTDHPELAGTLTSLANVLFAQGELGEASALLERALTIRERTLGADHPELAITLGNLAGVYYERDDFAAAAKMQQRALEILERAYGTQSPQIADGLGNLGQIHIAKGEPELAIPLMRRALALTERVYPEDHPDVAKRRGELGVALARARQYEEAVAMLVPGIARYERARGREDPWLCRSLAELARAELALGDRKTARLHAERAVALADIPGVRPRDADDARAMLATLDQPPR